MATKWPASLMKDGDPNIIFGKNAAGEPVEINITDIDVLDGFTIENDTVTPLTDIIINPGIKASTDGTKIVEMTVALTKSLASTWIQGDGGGLDTGTVTTYSAYSVHIIENDTSGDIDILLSLSPTAPTLPVGWSQIRRIGLVHTYTNPEILPFIQKGRTFHMLDGRHDYGLYYNVSATFNGTLNQTSTFFPSGINILANYNPNVNGGNGDMWIYSIRQVGDSDPVGGEKLLSAVIGFKDAGAQDHQQFWFPYLGINTMDIRLQTSYLGAGGAKTNLKVYLISYIDMDI